MAIYSHNKSIKIFDFSKIIFNNILLYSKQINKMFKGWGKMSLNTLYKLFEPLTTRNIMLSTETEEERRERIRRKYNLYHGKGLRKKKKKKKRGGGRK